MLGSLTDLATRASAAKCITASILCCAKTLSSWGRLARSTWQKTAPEGTAARWPSNKLTRAMTDMPREAKTSAQILPMYPAAPVTRIFTCEIPLSQVERQNADGQRRRVKRQDFVRG